MARNYITEQCCSVEDLRSYLRTWRPTDPVTVQQSVKNLDESIDYEKEHQNRVSIIKLLTAKRNAFKKLLVISGLVIINTSCKGAFYFWAAKEVVSFAVYTVFILVIAGLFIAVNIHDRAEKKRKGWDR